MSDVLLWVAGCSAIASGLMTWCYFVERAEVKRLNERLLQTTDANAATMITLVKELARPNRPAAPVVSNAPPPNGFSFEQNAPPAVRRVMSNVEHLAEERALAQLSAQAQAIKERAIANGYTMTDQEAEELVRSGIDVFRNL